jgi:hypothetical protein
MADNKNTSEKVQLDGIENMSGQEQEVSSSNSQNDAVAPPQSEDPTEKVSISTIMAVVVSYFINQERIMKFLT